MAEMSQNPFLFLLVSYKYSVENYNGSFFFKKKRVILCVYWCVKLLEFRHFVSVTTGTGDKTTHGCNKRPSSFYKEDRSARPKPAASAADDLPGTKGAERLVASNRG